MKKGIGIGFLGATLIAIVIIFYLNEKKSIALNEANGRIAKYNQWESLENEASIILADDMIVNGKFSIKGSSIQLDQKALKSKELISNELNQVSGQIHSTICTVSFSTKASAIFNCYFKGSKANIYFELRARMIGSQIQYVGSGNFIVHKRVYTGNEYFLKVIGPNRGDYCLSSGEFEKDMYLPYESWLDLIHPSELLKVASGNRHRYQPTSFTPRSEYNAISINDLKPIRPIEHMELCL